jgi:hypothetical protein
MKDYLKYRFSSEFDFNLNEKDFVTIVGNNNDLIIHTLLHGNNKCNIFVGDAELNKDNMDIIRKRIGFVLYKHLNIFVGDTVRDEIVFYMLNNKKADLLDEKAAFDNQIMQKILPRIQGSSESIKKMLEELLKICDSENFTASAKKINFMIKRYDEDGFTSYWL